MRFMIDTHCHLDVAEFDADRDAVLVRARSAGVAGIVIPAIHAAGWDGLLALCASADDLYPALGLHPAYLDRHRDSDLDELERAIAEHRPLAVGEIGLDYYLPDLDRAAQQALLEAQLSIAKSADLPVLLHVRKAHDDVLATLKRIGMKGGIAHAFNGSIQQAHQYLDLGFRLGFGGMLTFARSSRLRRLASDLPGEAIVLETDAPDMTVAAHRGERNSPEYLPDVLRALADVRGESLEVLAALTTANACAVLPGLGGIDRSGSGRVSAPPT
jgi:TatD DNase family protein